MKLPRTLKRGDSVQFGFGGGWVTGTFERQDTTTVYIKDHVGRPAAINKDSIQVWVVGE